MDSKARIYLNRAENEVLAAKALKRLSQQNKDKINFELPQDITFYSSVITHSYYSIFYAAKAILLTKNIQTKMPDVHKKTFEIFKKEFVDSGILDVELINIYKKLIIRADELLQIFKNEKWKRGHFTYKTIPQANKEPAEKSIKNAIKFIKNIQLVMEK